MFAHRERDVAPGTPGRDHRPHETLTFVDAVVLVEAVVACLVWGSLAVRVLLMDGEPSARALLACVALVLVGFGLGVTTWTLTAARRAARPLSKVPDRAGMNASGVMLAIVVIGVGAAPIVDDSTGVWGWTLMVAASLVGGLHLGLVFMRSAEPRAV